MLYPFPTCGNAAVDMVYSCAGLTAVPEDEFHCGKCDADSADSVDSGVDDDGFESDLVDDSEVLAL